MVKLYTEYFDISIDDIKIGRSSLTGELQSIHDYLYDAITAIDWYYKKKESDDDIDTAKDCAERAMNIIADLINA